MGDPCAPLVAYKYIYVHVKWHSECAEIYRKCNLVTHRARAVSELAMHAPTDPHPRIDDATDNQSNWYFLCGWMVVVGGKSSLSIDESRISNAFEMQCHSSRCPFGRILFLFGACD